MKPIGIKKTESTDFLDMKMFKLNMRHVKYYKRGYLDKFSSKLAIISILTSILDRGFSDYEDFKDQLNSIDLYLLEDDDSGELRDAALDLYNRLHKKA